MVPRSRTFLALAQKNCGTEPLFPCLRSTPADPPHMPESCKHKIPLPVRLPDMVLVDRTVRFVDEVEALIEKKKDGFPSAKTSREAKK